jgi:estrone sulfotransferase
MLRSLSRHRAVRSLYRVWWERTYGVSRRDVFLVSYPRSGNTWVRFMLLQARPDFREEDFQRIEEIIPDMHGRRPWYLYKRTNVIKSHLTYWQPFRRVIYLVRDGRSATYSNWRYQSAEGSFSGNFGDFVRHRHWPSSWSNHVASWINAPETNIIVRYEDLLSNSAHELLRIAALLNWPLSLDRARLIAQNSTKQRMRELERRGGLELHRVGPDECGLEGAYTPEVDRIFNGQLCEEVMRYIIPK